MIRLADVMDQDRRKEVARAAIEAQVTLRALVENLAFDDADPRVVVKLVDLVRGDVGLISAAVARTVQEWAHQEMKEDADV